MFYHPSLFHMAPTYDRIVPLAIADVVRAKNVLQVYGVTGVAEHNQGFVMVNNYPVKEVKIAGRLLSYAYNSYDQGNVKNPKNFYLLNIDDCSGESLLIRVKVLASKTSFLLRELREDMLVEVTGTVQYVQDFGKQVKGQTARIIGVSSDLDVEIAWWSHILETRRHLLNPWRYIHSKRPGDSKESQNDAEHFNVSESRFPSRERNTKLQKSRLELSSSLEAPLPSDLSVLDSITLTRGHRSKKGKKTTNAVELIDLTLSDTEPGCLETVCLEHTEALPDLPIMKSFQLASFSHDPRHSSHGNEIYTYEDQPTSQDSIIIIN